ncbi:hypothetical protein D0869_05753 [Hortaea werneckii]|uniref:Peptidase S54 rhomboid domain-containing protein n=1 Tax=Hortaea werneckii TaxID=91943 RepID=A0A3M6WWP3_HORWE|nr:hypothetical protein D0869_05753 [Hortaea werneckii]RMX84868.1 hypothetical protein D0868_15418 [Hortaea werneckii]RMY18681.1 hypothetical protein D0866_13099 [Hortaea werneckii]RMY23113.1 hypothetical protein D0867_02265 [Hortaea werneckii]
MLSTDTRSLRLSKALGQPIQILRQHAIPQTHLPTPPKSPQQPPQSGPSSASTPPSSPYGNTPSTNPPQPHRARDDSNPITPSLLSDHTTLSHTNLRANRPWTLLTSAFSHQEPLHFAFNMLSLKAFATILTRIPRIRAPHLIFLATGSALAGSLGFLYHDSSRRQNKDQAPDNLIGRTISGSDRQITRGIPGARSPGVESRRSALGASGMVLGFGAAATCLAPSTSMTVMFLPVPVPLWMLTAVYAAVDTYFLDDARSPVGHSAHLGGTVFGAVFYVGFLRRFGGVLGAGGGEVERRGMGRGWGRVLRRWWGGNVAFPNAKEGDRGSGLRKRKRRRSLW